MGMTIHSEANLVVRLMACANQRAEAAETAKESLGLVTAAALGYLVLSLTPHEVGGGFLTAAAAAIGTVGLYLGARALARWRAAGAEAAKIHDEIQVLRDGMRK